MLTKKQTLLIASALGALGVSLGAFGAHALKDLLLNNGRLDTYELAVRYHFYHTFALLAVGLLMDKHYASKVGLAAVLFFVGIILFSGSLYALSLFNVTKFAIVTPFGGVFLIAGWITLFLSILRNSEKS